MTLVHQELTGQIIGVAIAVHRELGPGFIEAFYARAFELELRAQQLPFEREVTVPVMYRGQEIGVHRLDFVVARTIVVELKAIKTLKRVHYAIAKSYLHAANLEHGLLINFAAAPLVAKRVIATPKTPLSSFLSDPKGTLPRKSSPKDGRAARPQQPEDEPSRRS